MQIAPPPEKKLKIYSSIKCNMCKKPSKKAYTQIQKASILNSMGRYNLTLVIK